MGEWRCGRRSRTCSESPTRSPLRRWGPWPAATLPPPCRTVAALGSWAGAGAISPGSSRELAIAAERAERPWGVGFLSWSATVEVVERALECRPSAVMLSFGDPRALAEPVRVAGVRLIVQVTDLAEAEAAVDAGADVIVAQGAEAGGHGGGRATLPFVPVVVDLVSPIPVLAAGGIADGRGVAAALALGAAGALVGTRFEATGEALLDAESTKAIIEGGGEDTERSRVLDIARSSPWPARYAARTLRNSFLDRWRGREAELEADDAAKAAFLVAVEQGDLDAVPIWASEAIDLVTDVIPAAELVGLLAEEAEEALRKAAGLVPPSS